MQATPESVSSQRPLTLRACLACANSKSRCIPATEATANKCSRCFKSRRDCVFPEKTAKKRKAPTSTTAELEERIQNLAALLAAQQQQQQQQQAATRSYPPTPIGQSQIEPQIHSSQPNLNNGAFSSSQNLLPGSRDPWATPVPLRQNSDASTLPFSRAEGAKEPHSAPAIPSAENTHISAGDEEYLVKIFRDHFFPRYPYLHIPPTISANELRLQRPWFFKAVTITASQDNREKQINSAKDFITELTVAMIVHGEKSLDMLQGLVIYNAWAYSISACSPQPASTGNSLLMIAMVSDLSLNRTSIGDSDVPEMLGDSTKSFSAENVKPTTARSMEERRTMLLVYYSTNMVSWSMKRMESLQYSPYLEHCRISLLECAEYESDIILAALVKIQSIIEKTNRSILDNDYPGGEKVPVWMQSKLARLELHAYWETLPLNIRQDENLTLNYLSANIALLEPCLLKHHFPRDLANGNSQRLQMLHACQEATHKLLDRCLARPLSDYFTFCGLDLATMGVACSTLFKLSLVDEVGWDLATIRKTVSFKEYFEKARINLEQVGLAIDHNQREPCKSSFYTSGAVKMRKIQMWYEAKIAKEAQPTDGRPPEISDPLSMDNLGIYGDRFWEDFMIDGGFL